MSKVLLKGLCSIQIFEAFHTFAHTCTYKLRAVLSLLMLLSSFLILCLPFQVTYREHFLESSTLLAAEVTVMTEADPNPLSELTDNFKKVYIAREIKTHMQYLNQ